ncbi:hypothetical protein AQUCO_00201167v1 [Aquilegia coerulea]|uniref:Uncharacterized protein n=1 Tax=Aquilegia coerulea TaxID=218851 RepID=A0A2G5F6M0_AQUCA|nr:hypothetical protein AQUCO_00201167v1 [Aquilegia coerulea]
MTLEVYHKQQTMSLWIFVKQANTQLTCCKNVERKKIQNITTKRTKSVNNLTKSFSFAYPSEAHILKLYVQLYKLLYPRSSCAQ